jgi:hypothetical protein
VNQRGVHYSVAIDSIYEAYGDGISTTNIIKAIQCDAKNGGQPNLRQLKSIIDCYLLCLRLLQQLRHEFATDI